MFIIRSKKDENQKKVQKRVYEDHVEKWKPDLAMKRI